jgi:hypothetical protein
VDAIGADDDHASQTHTQLAGMNFHRKGRFSAWGIRLVKHNGHGAAIYPSLSLVYHLSLSLAGFTTRVCKYVYDCVDR